MEKDHDTKMKAMDFRYTQTVDAIISSAKACGILENVIEAYSSAESDRDLATASNPDNPALVDWILKQKEFEKLTSLRNTMTNQEILVPIIQNIEAGKNTIEPAAKRIKLEQNVAEAKVESGQSSTEGTFATRIKQEKEEQSKKDPFVG